MTIYDKASWQIDAGQDKSRVIDHFKFIYNWLNENQLLSEDGKEILDFGIDSSISLNDQMVTKEGADFLGKHYEELIRDTNYNVEEEKEKIEELFKEFKQSEQSAK